jgi:Reverse transcriptase (RNA-dependent DNA polymerase)
MPFGLIEAPATF